MPTPKKRPSADNDLLKQELQRLQRELEVEAALGKVRNRAMAMRTSAEQAETSAVMFHEIKELGINVIRTGVAIIDEAQEAVELWMTTISEKKEVVQILDYVNIHVHPVYENILPARKKKKPYALTVLSGAEVKDYYQKMSTYLTLPKLKTYHEKEHFYAFFFTEGSINVNVADPLSEDECSILSRFANAFGLIYTRFIDLQKAEKQAQEARIEASLERVRSRSMAMRKSEELSEAAVMLYEELRTLGVTNFFNCGYVEVDIENTVQHGWMTGQEGHFMKGFNLPLTGDPVLQQRYEAWQRQDPVYYQSVGGEELWKHIAFVSPNYGSKEVDEMVKANFSDPTVFYSFNFTNGYLHIISNALLNVEDEELTIRFARVFELTYRRFLDLRTAEAQVREAKIEAALERIRARAMAMHRSSELMDVADVLREQMALLGQPELETAALHFYEEEPGHIVSWRAFRLGSETKGKITKGRMAIPTDSCDLVKEWLEQFHTGSPEYTVEVSGAKQKEWYKVLFRLAPEVGEAMVKQKSTTEPRYYHFSTFSGGALLMVAIKMPSEESIYLQRRAAGVFDLAYRRFLDLKQAEGLAWEARIELAMERVRARAMAMQRSDELVEASDVLFQELNKLGVQPIRTGVAIMDEDREMVEVWSRSHTGERAENKILGKVPASVHPMFHGIFTSWKAREPYFVYTLEGKELISYYQKLASHLSYPETEQYNKKETVTTFSFAQGTLNVVSHEPLEEAQCAIMLRFARVFGQLYQRFLDLKNAEAQTKEARIEAALEKVRSRSMAMHKSDELLDVITVVSEQLGQLGLTFDHTSFAVNNQAHDYDFWFAAAGQSTAHQIHVPYINNPMFERVREAQKIGAKFYSDTLTQQEHKHWIQHLLQHNEASFFSEKTKGYLLNSGYARSIAFMPHIMLVIGNYAASPYSDDDNKIIVRFAQAFEQTYTRFLDLQKAEAQTREATIEAALERVRGKAMAMHSSQDLTTTIGVFYKELESLDLTPRRCGVGLLNKETRIAELLTMSQGSNGTMVETVGSAILEGHPVLEQVYENWLSQKEYHPVLRGNEIKEYNLALRPKIPIPDLPPEAVMYGYFFYFAEGGVYAYTEQELSEDELKVYRRFTSVLSLTYKRYKDLRDAEARAQLAVREASLDRVRAEIASMRTADDLQRITPLIWRELRTLGVPFFRCGVLIVNEQEQKADYYLSTPEGRPLAALHLDFNTNLQVVQNAINHWREQKVYKDHWTKEQFVAFARSMMELGQIQTMKSYQGGDQPPEAITLQFIPFIQGMLYVGSSEPLTAGQIELVHALAEAFSTAYARYEDFTRLESAKVQVENTLRDLRLTQNQLVQSEKMASLGEMTAGIAHEIQNPLNFVNNFSEVSKELLEEMNEELEKGNAADAKQIAADVIQNLEKINFHGKRADGIVKSMLQHSRKSTGQKELTDINALCDEYLRLSFHGLRAKDKSFNAKFESELDPAVGMVSVMPQEIGRVILNLINNAFYAVSEKLKAKGQKQDAVYEPTVIVSTKNLENKIEISVSDNGDGIPNHIKDKIFQPFFTTKPTGQGTGLGLSLSYDIVKAHGGSLISNSEAGRGTTMKIELPR